MKKTAIYALFLAAALCSSCTEDFGDWAAPQGFDAEEAQNVAFAITSGPSIVVENTTTEKVAIFTPTVTAENMTGVDYTVTLNGTTIEADAQGQVSLQELVDIVTALYGKRPTERTLSGQVNAYVAVGGEVVKATAPIEVKITPEAPLIESAYYFIGATNGWSSEAADLLKFNHSGADVYDDPVFTLTVAAPYDETGARIDQWFNIVPESAIGADNFWDLLLGSDTGNGDDRMEAGLAYKVDGAANAFMQPASDGAKFYSITLNMMDYTMTISPLSFEEFIYVPGNPQGWKPSTAPALRSAAFDGVYIGYCYMDGEFKFTKGRSDSWDEGEYNSTSFTELGGIFSQGSDTNISASPAGFYYLEANVAAGSLKAEEVSWSICGSAIDAGWSILEEMTWNPEDDSWDITVALSAGEFKFLTDSSWTHNLGGTVDDLTEGGANLAIAEDGTYEIRLYPTRSASEKIYCTITKQ